LSYASPVFADLYIRTVCVKQGVIKTDRFSRTEPINRRAREAFRAPPRKRDRAARARMPICSLLPASCSLLPTSCDRPAHAQSQGKRSSRPLLNSRQSASDARWRNRRPSGLIP